MSAPRALSRPRLSAISSVTGWMRTPTQPRSTLPFFCNCSMTGRASDEGMAKPMPIEPPDGEHPVADARLVGIAPFDLGQRLLRLDLEEGKIGHRVAADDLRLEDRIV